MFRRLKDYAALVAICAALSVLFVELLTAAAEAVRLAGPPGAF